ncbi:beta-galactosidase-like [Varroa jacobsoni]|uniref:beta-galactosidase-like n=1 Tax=Varroa jacobsoni TaxID=62625 RepID=UPI000BF2788D|nr:beta-galactosidase-like [Varroa jacobsoni]XP_022688283.1 beta-galactosidase-like [Varroa jacobsoni]
MAFGRSPLLLLSAVAVVFGVREFKIDFENDRFVKDGKPFQIISGSIHYYNVPYQYWEDRLRSMRDCGINTLQTYLEWRTLEPHEGVFDFTGQNDIVQYIKTAQNQDLLVNLRLGPYIDSEREMGGLPWWLMQVNPAMKLRTNDTGFVSYVARYWRKVFRLIKPLLYTNGGPIILVQIENEYGSYSACDFVYTSYLRELAIENLGEDVVYYTTDGNGDGFLKCGKNAGVYITIDFGSRESVDSAFAAQRRHQRHGPLVNSEYYTGWFNVWGIQHHKVPTDAVCHALDEMLSRNASVNLYMFHGGTHFGFDNGAQLSGDTFQLCITSYDYDAPLDEAGDPTDKYFAIKEIIRKYAPVPANNPSPKPKLSLGNVPLNKTAGFMGLLGALRMLNSLMPSKNPMSFEELNHPYGLVAYETTIPFQPANPAVLKVQAIRDRGYVFVDHQYQGMLSREVLINQVAIRARKGSTLTILVENQGRVCYGDGIKDIKGIIGEVNLGSKTLTRWFHYLIPDKAEGDEGYDMLTPFINDFRRQHADYSDLRDTEGFGVYQGTLTLNENDTPILLDTFVRLDGWVKGFIVVNGINLGRYWPAQGPQVTLYVPGVYLKYGANRITIVELEGAPASQSITFVDTPVIDGSVPTM